MNFTISTNEENKVLTNNKFFYFLYRSKHESHVGINHFLIILRYVIIIKIKITFKSAIKKHVSEATKTFKFAFYV